MADQDNRKGAIGVDEQDDPFPCFKGVLLGDMILKYIEKLQPPLIEFADKEKNVKPASYNLRLGDLYYQDGFYKKLSDENPIITIDPHGMIVVSTHEKLHLPRYLIGRWNLRVTLVYLGLLWAGGPQVDPGFSGFLFCPLYNLSNKEVTLKRGEHIFTLDFEKTTKYDKGSKFQFNSLEDREITHYVPSYPLKSSVADLRDQVKATEASLTKRVDDLQTSLLVGLSIVFTGLTVLATLPSLPGLHVPLAVDPITFLLLLVTFASLIVSIFSIRRTRRHDRTGKIYSELVALETEFHSKSITAEQYEQERRRIASKLRGRRKWRWKRP